MPYAGDTLWALMVYWLCCAAGRGFAGRFPARCLRWQVMLAALLFAFAIEFSQLSQALWLQSLRATRLGALVLGHGFLLSDLVCYTVGIVIGAGLDRYLITSLAIRLSR